MLARAFVLVLFVAACRGGSGEPTPSFDVGHQHACRVTEGGAVSCWGGNMFGQLGVPEAHQPVPSAVTVAGLGAATLVAVGGHHTCALVDGVPWCWGNDADGQTGGQDRDRHVPRPVPHVTDAVALSAGDRATCAATREGAVWCWGRIGPGDGGDTGPRLVGGPVDVVQVAVGNEHACARSSDGVWCWGGNRLGQIGDHSRDDRPHAVQIVAEPVVDIDAGMLHTCVATGAGKVLCWGMNGEDGMLGRGMSGDLLENTVPAPVQGIADAVEVSTGANFSCARRTTGEVSCWGSNLAQQLGPGSSAPSATPVAVSTAIVATQAGSKAEAGTIALTDVVALASGDFSTCAWLKSGTMACWGDDRFGQLGTGQARTVPVPQPAAAP